MEYTTSSPAETVGIATTIATTMSGGDFYTFTGDLGAGKTTFIQGVLGALGAEGPFTSPTFTIVRTYDLEEASPGYALGIHTVYHIDAYRVDEDAILDIGWEEMISNHNAVILLEWPERIASHIPEAAIRFVLTAGDHDERSIAVV